MNYSSMQIFLTFIGRQPTTTLGTRGCSRVRREFSVLAEGEATSGEARLTIRRDRNWKPR